MKILNLKFKNINSLAGEWAIDFTKPEFTNNGLFVITGKTGAGKSSILDAISLALYGKTPRVEITHKINDVMTRNTNDCYSEIIFEVGQKKWKSAWKQERTRTGNLKDVNRLIADATDKIIAEKVRDCDDKIVEILGLTFEQFTKVIMLAQGSFAAFLQAEKNGKGELLEQITGTEIYGEISKKVFERNKTEKEKLDKIIVEFSAIQVFSEEEIEILKKEILEFNINKKLIDNELQIIENAKKWLSDLESLKKQIEETKQKLPILEQNFEITTKTLNELENNLKIVKIEKEKNDKILLKVRELDTKITEKNKLLDPILQTINELKKNKNNLTELLENNTKKLTETKKFLQEKQDWTKENIKYETLVEKFVAIENQSLELDKLFVVSKDKKNDYEKAKKDLDIKKSNYKDAEIFFKEKEKVLNEKEEELKVKKIELLEILAGREVCDYQEEKENITKFGIQIKNLVEVEKEILNNQKELEKYKEFINISENSEKELSKKISENKTTAKNLKERIELLDETIKLNKTIQSMEQHRKSLEDGKPCPLCGSENHPYSLGNVPKIGEKETELLNLKKSEQQILNTIQQDEKTITKTISDKDNMLINNQKTENYLSDNHKKQSIILEQIKLIKSDFFNTYTIDLLEDIHKQKQEEYKIIDKIITNATKKDKEIKNLQEEEIPKLQQTKQSAEKSKINLETNQKLAEQILENQKILLAESERQHKEKEVEFVKILNNYDVLNIDILKKRLNEWNQNKTSIENLQLEINKLENLFAIKNSEMENLEQQLFNKTTEKQSIETEKQNLSAERHNLFENKIVEDEEKRFIKLLENIETEKLKAEKLKIDANTELAKNQAIINEKEKSLKEKQIENLSKKTVEELQIEYEEKKPQSDLFSEKIGANSQALNYNEENLQKNHTKLLEKEIQQKICEKWGKLNELIGSQDGKKYRNFVQALTFEHLIGLANNQLKKMSERYILKRIGDTTNPFELSVIDKFQNCEERTAQNLSGGEKFIVSLSLALGLSNMASKNMKIDTMFIDEGFGTLDSDYLNIALSALSNLHNEGKLIGVISHLSELKERIATHIEVITIANGHSKIKNFE